MKRRIFGKWIMLCLFAVLLAAAPAGKTAAEEKSSLEILLENAGLLAQDLDVEELREYYRQFESVIQSDEFQNLIEYEEVRDLITALVDKGVDFAIEDPDLAQKILITAGMDEKIVSLLPLLLEKGSKAGEALEAFKQSEEGKAILDSLNVSVDVDREALTKALLEFILGHYAKTDEPEAEAVYQALRPLRLRRTSLLRLRQMSPRRRRRISQRKRKTGSRRRQRLARRDERMLRETGS